MTYILLKTNRGVGYNGTYTPVNVSKRIEDIETDIKKRVKDGCPVNDLKIVQEVPFEFKCAITLIRESEETE